MASGKGRRRPGGHPAKVAQRRERERARSQESPLRRTARAACREAATLQDALDAELWASALLGSWWPPSFGLQAGDADLEVGGPVVEEMARMGGAGALAGLIAIGELSETRLGSIAKEHAKHLRGRGIAAPRWARAIVDAEILRTAVMREEVFDDGRTMFIEAVHAGGERHVIGVYIDNNLGVMAKDILLADSIDKVQELIASNPQPGGALMIEPIDPAEAGARIRDAMELTDMTLGAPVGEDYAALRSLAILRADELPFSDIDVSVAEMPIEERDELLSTFLKSPEGAGIEAGGDEAHLASLAIDYCAGYVDGRPLRWSPVVVELFMTDWLPRKLIADRTMFEALPAVLEAWVRFAGRTREIPDWAIELTVDSIPRWTEEMLERADDPAGGGPGKQLVLAAQQAGVDLGDEQAVASFLAGWNAGCDAD